ncbi:MAG: YeiH family protein [Psychrobacter sp.]|nr:YeiH family protein [Psychrobacter sp.]
MSSATTHSRLAPLVGYIPNGQHLLGLVLVLVGSLFSMWLNTQIDVWSHGQVVGLSSLTLAIIIGMVLGNTVYPSYTSQLATGVNFAKGQLLRLAIMLYGFKLTLTEVASVGMSAVVIDALVLSSTFMITYYLGTRVLKVDRKTTLLIGSGASICGAAAVIAAEPVVEAESHKVTIAVATVVVFGTLAMILYPVFFHMGWLSPWLNPEHYGMYIGSTIHEVAQVVVAGNAVNTDVGNTAVVTKMIRVMMLAPFLLILSFMLTPSTGSESDSLNSNATQVGKKQQSAFMQRLTHVKVPWFAFIFIGIVVLHTLIPLSDAIVHSMVVLDDVLLTMAMFALGLTTHMSAIKQAGVRPLLLGAIMFGWLILGGGAINVLITQLMM